MAWNPTVIKSVDAAYATASEAMRVKTDAGYGFLKALGNRGGPHLLAADWLGTKLAEWLGLPVFETAIIQVCEAPEIVFDRGGKAQIGPAFIAREIPGHVWSGQAGELDVLVNPEDIPRLVVFDTWTRNPDRHPPDLATRKVNLNNVFLADAPKAGLRLIAMDHTHCFAADRDLGPRTSRIDAIRDERIHGLFPEFEPYFARHGEALTATLLKLMTLRRNWLDEVVATIPEEWEVDVVARRSLAEFIWQRAAFVAHSFVTWLPDPLRPVQPPLV